MSIMRTLFWSEWRRQRKTVLLLIASTVLLYLFMLGMVQFELFLAEIEMTAVALVIGLPFLYCIALGGSFANEFIDKSKSFLLGLPVSTTKIYFAKYLSNLLMFLVISSIGVLLMHSLTDLTHGRNFYDDLERWKSLIIIVPITVWILLHASVFCYNLINRSSNNALVALLLLPVMFVLLSFGTSSVCMFFFKTDDNWIIAYFLISSAILYFSLIGLAWYLWDKRISREQKCLKPISFLIVILLTISALCYGISYAYVTYKFDSTMDAAKKSGMKFYKNKVISWTINTKTKKELFYTLKFAKKRRELYCTDAKYKKLNKQFPSYYFANWIDPKNVNYVSKKKQKEISIYILNNPKMKILYSILEKSLNEINSLQDKSLQENKNIIHFYMTRELYTLIDLAYAQRYAGRNKAFFETIKKAIKLYYTCLKIKFVDSSSWNTTTVLGKIYKIIIKAGAESSEYTDYYIDALKKIKNINIYPPAIYPFRIISFNDFENWQNQNYKNNLICKWGTSLYLNLRLKQKFIAITRTNIKYNALYLDATKATKLQKVIKRYNSLRKKEDGLFEFIRTYFTARSEIVGDKLCLALKIYRCRYGKYPEKLQELCPGILEKIPLEPQLSKPYIYKKEGDGFYLQAPVGNSFYDERSNFIKYQPWNPQGKENTK